ncbi:hypothetical protein JB92DRAFT_3208985 [Gautieria morchelliformis]|nr:hypothetical protein JB92DRAFT_3208985 [Gautieria morchelliformis]
MSNLAMCLLDRPLAGVGYQAAAITDGHGSQNNVPGFWNGNQHHVTQPYVYAPPQFQYAPPAAGMLPVAQHAPVPVGPLVSPAPDHITQPMLPLALAKNRLGLPPPIHHIHVTIVPPVQYAKQLDVPVADQVIDYPNGDQTQEYPTAEAPSKFTQTKWSWHSNGGRGGTEIRQNQFNSTITTAYATLPWVWLYYSPAAYMPCTNTSMEGDPPWSGMDMLVPRGFAYSSTATMSGKLTRVEEDAVDVQIAHRSDATALKLRTGNGTLGSTPLADWLDTPASEEHAQHGFVVDGDHSFFKSGVLLATCAWSVSSTTHHRPHFKHLFGQIVQAASSKFQAKLLLHIMDYSAAARAAHAAEYSAAMTSQLINFGFLSAEAQQVEIQRFRKEASQYLVGCETHWLGSCRRIKHSGAIVAPPLVSKFEHLTSRLLLPSITPNEFGQITDELRRVFPKAVGWLNWWLQPAVACMIFPCHRKVDNDVFAEVPHTSNPVEAQHSLLHHATGINHDLIGGLERLYLHVRQLEGQYHAVKGITAGHVTPPEPRDPPKRGYHKKLDDNDGRPPDTIEALEKASKSTTYYQESGHKGNSNQLANDGTLSLPHALKSYIWSSPNSCFWDVGTELLYRAFIGLNPELKKNIFWMCDDLDAPPDILNCNIMGCGALAPVTTVETSWPTVLSLMTPSGPQISETSPYQPECTVSFTGDALVSSTIIDYKLVGKIIHVEEQEHWIAEICQGNMAHEYDDMCNGGSLAESGPATVLEHWREHTSLIMYRRCSTQHCTRRSIAAILKDYEQVEDTIPFLREDTNGVLSEVHQPSQEPLTPAILPSPPVTPIQTENASATLSPSTAYHESPPNQSCGSQGDGHDDPLDTIQCVHCENWSHIPCIDLPKNYRDSTFEFKCSNCVPTLNNSDIGMYVLLCPSPEEALGKSRQGRHPTRIFHAARICSFSGSSAVLEWFAGNIYATEKARPSDLMVQRHVTEVKGALAFFPANINSTNVGQIEWPLRLWEDGYELRGYKNVGISKALIDAMPAILRILKGASPHPVMYLWTNWQDRVTSKGLAREQHRSMFHTYYHVPFMAGDASIVVDACEQVTWKLNGHNLDPDHRFMLTMLSLVPGQLLLKMVVLRVYFGLRPGHDHEVWELWREGRIQHVWSDYELAMSAAQWLKWPVNEGIAMGDVRQLPKPDSPHAHALRDFLPVTVVTTDNQPHEWSLPQVGTGLTEVTFGGMETKPQVKVKRRPQPIFATRADSPQIRPKMRKLTPAPSNRVKRNEQQAGIGEEEIGPRRSKH